MIILIVTDIPGPQSIHREPDTESVFFRMHVFGSEVGTLCTLINTLWYAYHGEDQANFYLAGSLVRPGTDS